MPHALLWTVRLIRSKGVGIYFVTQSPADIPDSVLGQLGNRIQHALRAYTPKDQKAVKAAAQTFRPNPALDRRLLIWYLLLLTFGTVVTMAAWRSSVCWRVDRSSKRHRRKSRKLRSRPA
ncbi:helicase HerA-like domain-containing protein [Alcanivorax sp.]|uniref:helicase HerA-like domain-containing protein n=1 Tax=Alcanivorax sp. TaxID=1872427 RepID=UPI00342460A2